MTGIREATVEGPVPVPRVTGATATDQHSPKRTLAFATGMIGCTTSGATFSDRLPRHALALRAYDQMIGPELGDVAVDGCISKAPCGREHAGPSPAGRRKGGLKRSVATENYGIPLGIAAAGANRHDSPLGLVLVWHECGTPLRRRPMRCEDGPGR